MKRLDSMIGRSIKCLVRYIRSRAFFVTAFTLCHALPLHATVSEGMVAMKIGINNIVPSLLTSDGQTLTGQNSPLTGAGAALYQCVFDGLSLDYQLSMLPVGRLEILLERGEIDMGALVSQTAERDQYALFSATVFETDFIVATNRPEIPEDKQFTGWNLSTALNTVFHDIAKVKFQAELHPTNSWNSAMSMLRKQRVDGVFLASHILELDVSPHLSEGVKTFSVERKPVGLYVSKRSKAPEKLLLKLNSAIELCKLKHPLD